MKSNEPTAGVGRESEAGIGRPDEATLIQRAQELARIDGREEANERDFASAREDLVTTGAMPSSPEAGHLENLTAWDTPLSAAGGQAPERELDDEANLGAKLVEEGIEEADHDRRVAASEARDDDER